MTLRAARTLQDQQDEDYAHEVARQEMRDYIVRRDAFHEQQRALANEAVSKALTGYRWWGWTNIINTLRLAIQAWRQRREARD